METYFAVELDFSFDRLAEACHKADFVQERHVWLPYCGFYMSNFWHIELRWEAQHHIVSPHRLDLWV